MGVKMMTLGQITGSKEFFRDAINSMKDRQRSNSVGLQGEFQLWHQHRLLGRISEERIQSP